MAGDLDDLFDRLALAEYHFGKTASQASVVIDPGETEIRIRQVPQGPRSLADRYPAGL
jgi:hypothetical protein